ncbi:MAG: hypothetical protein AAGC57_10870 [Pseudomonadota bacterium]
MKTALAPPLGAIALGGCAAIEREPLTTNWGPGFLSTAEAAELGCDDKAGFAKWSTCFAAANMARSACRPDHAAALSRLGFACLDGFCVSPTLRVHAANKTAAELYVQQIMIDGQCASSVTTREYDIDDGGMRARPKMTADIAAAEN